MPNTAPPQIILRITLPAAMSWQVSAEPLGFPAAPFASTTLPNPLVTNPIVANPIASLEHAVPPARLDDLAAPSTLMQRNATDWRGPVTADSNASGFVRRASAGPSNRQGRPLPCIDSAHTSGMAAELDLTRFFEMLEQTQLNDSETCALNSLTEDLLDMQRQDEALSLARSIAATWPENTLSTLKRGQHQKFLNALLLHLVAGRDGTKACRMAGLEFSRFRSRLLELGHPSGRRNLESLMAALPLKSRGALMALINARMNPLSARRTNLKRAAAAAASNADASRGDDNLESLAQSVSRPYAPHVHALLRYVLKGETVRAASGMAGLRTGTSRAFNLRMFHPCTREDLALSRRVRDRLCNDDQRLFDTYCEASASSDGSAAANWQFDWSTPEGHRPPRSPHPRHGRSAMKV